MMIMMIIIVITNYLFLNVLAEQVRTSINDNDKNNN
jgi:uncharacterized membrane protein